MQIRNNSSRYHSGPISDMYHECVKYELCDAVCDGAWACFVETACTKCTHLFSVYRNVISRYSLCIWWRLADHNPDVLNSCRSVVNIVTGGCVWFNKRNPGVYGNRCSLCEYNVKDSVCHFLYNCEALSGNRLAILNAPECTEICENYVYLSIEEKWQVLLSDVCVTDFHQWVPVGTLVASGLHNMLNLKRQLITSNGWNSDVHVMNTWSLMDWKCWN